jgi:hypothetical protein
VDGDPKLEGQDADGESAGSEEVFDGDGNKKCKHNGKNERIVFKKRVSNASCQLTSIDAFIYGGFSSRFWMLRKHINNMGYQFGGNLELPFYSW